MSTPSRTSRSRNDAQQQQQHRRRRWLPQTCDLCLVLVLCAAMVTVTAAAPRNHHHKRRQQPELDVKDREWVNTCGVPLHSADDMPVAPATTSTSTTTTTTAPVDTAPPAATGGGNPRNNRHRRRNVKKLLATLNIKIREISMRTAIDTHKISEWFTKNATYDFLDRINGSDQKFSLKTWHIQTQVYIGAFQNLVVKQRQFENFKNEDNRVSTELYHMMRSATTLLCEIITAMGNSNIPLPADLSRERMDRRLNFSSATGVDTLDLQFTKVRFIEFLHGMHDVLVHNKEKIQMRRKSLRRAGGARASTGAAAQPSGRLVAVGPKGKRNNGGKMTKQQQQRQKEAKRQKHREAKRRMEQQTYAERHNGRARPDNRN